MFYKQTFNMYFVGAPSAPSDLLVASKAHLSATLEWEPAFLPYNMVPQYRVYVDGELEAVVDEPLYELKRSQVSCEALEVMIAAFNEVGMNTSEPIELTIPSGTHQHVYTTIKIVFIGYHKF